MSKSEKKMGIIKPKERPLVKEVCNKNKKKPKKDKRPWQDKYYVCPFCDTPLGKIDEKENFMYFRTVPGKPYSTMIDNVSTTCVKCGAFEVKNACPSCHRETWFLPDDDGKCEMGEYRHSKRQAMGCGFSGRLKLKINTKKSSS